MGKKILILMFVLILMGIFLVDSISNEEKVDEEVYNVLKDNEEVPVKVEIKKNIFSETKEEIIEIDENDLEELIDESDIKSVEFAPQFTAFLDDTISQINVTNVWAVNLTQNITGIDETICVIDTGINFSHSDLSGRNKTCVIDCYNKACVEDCSVSDDNGHGTHVAGIAGAGGSINGVAIEAGLIGVKVLDENGNSHSTTGTADIKNAIDWCVANRVNHNISVISMSLGTTTLYTNYCDSSFSANLAKAINNATLFNISVVVASGNDGSTTQIASPACIENSTAVGSIGKDDSTFAYNRNNITDFIAPGGTSSGSAACSPGSMDADKICSTYNNGAYIAFAGTSMAAPHLAGAFALFRQFFRLQNGKDALNSEVENEFNNTGKFINDSSGTGIEFPRVDVWSALVSIDSSNPTVSLSSPTNNTVQFNQNITFNCSANDVQLDNLTLYVYNSTGDIYNSTEVSDVSGVNGDLSKEITNIPYGSYEWNCLAYDNNGNFSFASNNTLTIGRVSTTLNSPVNNLKTNQNQTYNCSAETESGKLLTNTTISVWNSTEDLIYNTTNTLSGISNSTLFYYNFTLEGNYTWNCLSYNNHTESDWASNFTITYDVTNPTIDGVCPSGTIATTTSAVISVNSSEDTNSSVNYGTATSLGTVSSNTSLRVNHTISLTGLSASTTYYYNITNCDEAGNCVVNGTNSFATSAAPSNDGGSGGGGGGGGSISAKGEIYEPTISETSSSGGYRKELKKNDKIKFNFFTGSSEHTLTINSINVNSVNITIQSNPIKLTLGVGQSAKLNLTNSDYYDLYVKLNSIKSSKGDITIQTINELIPKPDNQIAGDAVDIDNENPNAQKMDTLISEISKMKIIIYSLVVIFIIMSIFLLLRKNKLKKTKNKNLTKLKEEFKKIKPKKSKN